MTKRNRKNKRRSNKSNNKKSNNKKSNNKKSNNYCECGNKFSQGYCFEMHCCNGGVLCGSCYLKQHCVNDTTTNGMIFECKFCKDGIIVSNEEMINLISKAIMFGDEDIVSFFDSS